MPDRLLHLAALVLIVLLAAPADAAYVRANCRGIQEFSTSNVSVNCAENNELADPQGNLVSGFTSAMANLAEGRLVAAAAGGQIRDFGYNGGEAMALRVGHAYEAANDWVDRHPGL